MNPEIAKMFFALKLIQSYGSGLRRAKDAMKANESPKLEFRPADNNDDDYTQAIAYINREYAESQDEDMISIQSKKKRENKADQSKNSGQKRRGNGGSLSEVLSEVISEQYIKKITPIVHVLEEKGCITPKEAEQATGRSTRTVLRYLTMLVDNSIVYREGETNQSIYKVYGVKNNQKADRKAPG